MGQQKMKVQTNEGRDAMVVYQIAEMSRPLTAVSQTCDNGNWVVFTPEGGFIWNLKSGGKTSFERNGVYMSWTCGSVKLTSVEAASSRIFPGRDAERADSRRKGSVFRSVPPGRTKRELDISKRFCRRLC